MRCEDRGNWIGTLQQPEPFIMILPQPMLIER